VVVQAFADGCSPLVGWPLSDSSLATVGERGCREAPTDRHSGRCQGRSAGREPGQECVRSRPPDRTGAGKLRPGSWRLNGRMSERTRRHAAGRDDNSLFLRFLDGRLSIWPLRIPRGASSVIRASRWTGRPWPS